MSLKFRARNTDFLEIADVAAHRTTPMMVCFWVKLTQTPGAGQDYYVIAKEGSTPALNCWFVDVQDDDSWVVAVISAENGEDTNFNNGARNLTPGSWALICCKMDSNGGQIRSYFNASLGGSIGASGTMPVSSGSAIRIGCKGDTGDAASDGILAEVEDVRIYNRILSGAEVTAMYNSGAPGGIGVDGVTSGLVGQWILNGGPINTTPASVLDASGNGYNATVHGAPTWQQGLLPIAGGILAPQNFDGGCNRPVMSGGMG